MELFKRSQVDDAIAKMWNADAKRAAEINRRLTRLLQTDRAQGAPYAFFSSDESGTGSETHYSSYEAFALFTALVLLERWFPQAPAVGIMRTIRRRLSKHHKRILGLDETALFDAEKIVAQAKAGALVVSNTAPAFLTIVSYATSSDGGKSKSAVNVCEGMAEVSNFIRSESTKTNGATFLEIVTPVFQFDRILRSTTARRRGRPSSKTSRVDSFS